MAPAAILAAHWLEHWAVIGGMGSRCGQLLLYFKKWLGTQQNQGCKICKTVKNCQRRDQYRRKYKIKYTNTAFF